MKPCAFPGGARLAARGRTVVAILVLCILPAIYSARYAPFIHDVVAPGDSYFEIAMRRLAAEYWREGTVPLWNPLSRCGTPLAADSQSGALYPLNILYLVLAPVPASNITLFLHFSLAGIFMFWYLERLGVSRVGALFGAVTYMFSGFLVAHKSHTAMQNAAAWMPLILLCLIESMRRRWGGFTFLGAAAVAMQILAGHLQVVVLTAIPALLLVLLPPHDKDPRARAAARVGSFIAVFATGCLLASVLLFPAIEYARLSPRAAMSYDEFVSYSFHPFLIPLLFFPNALGTEIPTLFGRAYWGPWNLTEVGSGFCGIAPVALAAVAVIALRRSDRAVRAHTVMAIAAFALALGNYNPLYRLMYYVPVYNLFRCPARNLLAYDFAIAALAAFGFDALTGRRAGASVHGVQRAAGRVVAGLACVAAASGAFLALFPSFIASPCLSSGSPLTDNISPRLRELLQGINLRSNSFLFPLLIVCATAALLLSMRSGRRVKIASALLFLVLWIDLMSFGSLHWAIDYRPERFFDTTHYPRPVKELIALGARTGEFRVCPFLPDSSSRENSLTAVMNTFYGIPSSAGYGPLGISRYLELTGSDWMGHTPERFIANSPLFSMLNLRYLLCAAELCPRLEACAGPGGRPPYRKIWAGDRQAIYENSAWLPRAWLVARARAVRSYEEARGILTDPSAGFNPREEALVQTESPLPLLGPSAGTVDRVRIRPNKITVAYRAPDRNFLVLSEIFYPGWKAHLDGKDAPILPADGILRGIVAPPGAHEVDLTYAPRSLRVGLACSGVTAAALLLIALRSRRGERRKRAAVVPGGDMPGTMPHKEVTHGR
jgi:hypothetical protein